MRAFAILFAVLLAIAFSGCSALLQELDEEAYGEARDSTPAISLSKSEGTDRLEVVSADAGADWSRIQVRADVSGVKIGLNAPPTKTPGDTVSAVADGIDAGDFVSFCVGDGADAVEVTLADTVTNALVFRSTFAALASC